MLRHLAFLATLILVSGGSRPAVAHDGLDDTGSSTRFAGSERQWTHASGRFHVDGSFVALKGGQVQVRKHDGALLDIKLEALSHEDRQWVRNRNGAILRLNLEPRALLLAQNSDPSRGKNPQPPPEMYASFKPFAETLKLRWDAESFFVESNGIPDHQMMVGITSWQQQVPLPQTYTGDNAWRIPLHPVPAKNPLSAKNRFLRGAISLAANGIPIFNPLNNRGDDAYLFGELDDFGGHCGRADDYHYHLPPVHLQKTIGKSLAIAYALDGYPIYGYDEPDGSKVKQLDAFNGHEDDQKRYHYHSTKTYPYLNGGFHGEVVERDGQVDPQPHANPVRPALPPLRGAKITDFRETRPGSHRLTYEIRGRKSFVNYTLAQNGSVEFQFVDDTGKTRTETYQRRGRGPGNRPGGPRPPRPEDEPPPRDDDRRPPPGEGGRRSPRRPPPDREAELAPPPDDFGTLVVTSSAVKNGGNLPADFTCDGASVSPPLDWKDVPAGTKSFAISVWHVPPDGGVKSYWVVYNIPADVAGLPRDMKGIGVVGLNDKRRAGYDPMCSQGPGPKTYHITVYALSKELNLARGQANRAELLRAMERVKLSQKTLSFVYERAR